jgi:hypothetical protein
MTRRDRGQHERMSACARPFGQRVATRTCGRNRSGAREHREPQQRESCLLPVAVRVVVRVYSHRGMK